MKNKNLNIQQKVSRFTKDIFLDNISNAESDTNRFLVQKEDGSIAFRTGSEILSDIGGSSTDGDITSVVAGTNLTGGGTSGDVTINLADASTSAKGAASFSSSNFSVSSGAVSIKSGGVDLTDEVTGTLPVGKGGTGAASLTDNAVLLGNGSGAIEASAHLTYSNFAPGGGVDIDQLTIGDTNATGGKVLTPGGINMTVGPSGSSGTNVAGANLTLQGGQSTGNTAGGSIRFLSSVTGGSSNSNPNTTVEIAALDNAGNLQIDGGLTVGSTSFVNSSGVIQVATQGTIDHDSLANFVAAEHYRWDTDISGTATINAANIPTLNQNTTGSAATATNLVASTSTAVQLGTIELGHASDTTIARSAAGKATIEGREITTNGSSGTNFITFSTNGYVGSATSGEVHIGHNSYGNYHFNWGTVTVPTSGTRQVTKNEVNCGWPVPVNLSKVEVRVNCRTNGSSDNLITQCFKTASELSGNTTVTAIGSDATVTGANQNQFNDMTITDGGAVSAGEVIYVGVGCTNGTPQLRFNITILGYVA